MNAALDCPPGSRAALSLDDCRLWRSYSSVLRFPFVYGEGDGHLASLGTLARQFGLHPAQTYAVAHHRDMAAAVRLALTGVMDGRIVNGHLDGTLIREFGFAPSVPTIHAAARDGIL